MEIQYFTSEEIISRGLPNPVKDALTIVLDLDGTIFPHYGNSGPADYTVRLRKWSFMLASVITQLRNMSMNIELIIWSHGNLSHVREIVAKIEAMSLDIDFVIYREKEVLMKKNISCLNRSVKRLLVIDDYADVITPRDNLLMVDSWHAHRPHRYSSGGDEFLYVCLVVVSIASKYMKDGNYDVQWVLDHMILLKRVQKIGRVLFDTAPGESYFFVTDPYTVHPEGIVDYARKLYDGMFALVTGERISLEDFENAPRDLVKRWLDNFE